MGRMTSAYITTVGPDRTIVLPPEMPVGMTVAVVVVPSDTSEPEDEARRARFEATVSAIRAASASSTVEPPISDDELTTLVERARKTRSA